MGKCPTCGKSAFRLKTDNCIICGREGCENCMLGIELFAFGNGGKTANTKAWICRYKSKTCYDKFIDICMNTSIMKDEIGHDVNVLLDQETWDGAFTTLCQYAIMGNKLKKDVWANLTKGMKFPGLRKVNVPYGLKEDIFKLTAESIAEKLERAGKYLEAAQIYENLGKYDKARGLRGKDKQIVVKKVSVDLNSLLKQVKDGGLVTVYRCPHCGGKLKVNKDTKAEELTICQYCNTAIKALDIAQFLEDILS